MLCKLVITFIAARHSHNSPGSITDQNIFTDPDRDLFFTEWVNAISSRKNPADLFFCHPFPFTAALYISNIFFNGLLLFGGSYLFYQLMFRRDHHEINTEDRVRT